MSGRAIAVALLLVVATASGCSGCPTALLEGTLVRDDGDEMAVHNAEVDVTYPVAWPAGWSSRDVDGVLHVYEESGEAVGAEGDQFSAGGGFSPGPDEVFTPCGAIRITTAG
jgi:hypothetical protein